MKILSRQRPANSHQFPEGPAPWETRDAAALGALLLLAVLIRIPHLAAPYVINMDAITYVRRAQAIASGNLAGGLAVTFPSIFPMLIALLYPLVGDWVVASRLLPILFGVLTTIPCYLLGRLVVGREWAWAPALFFTVCPTVVSASLDVIRDPLFWFLLVSFLYTLLRAAGERRLHLYALAGVLALVSIAVRLDGGLMLFAIAPVLWATLREERNLKSLLKPLAIFLPLAVAVSLGLIVMARPLEKHGFLEWKSVVRRIHGAAGAPGLREEVNRLIDLAPKPRTKRFLTVALEERWILGGWDLLEHWVKGAHPLFFLLMLWGLLRKPDWRRVEWQVPALVMIVWLAAAFLRTSGAFAIGKRHLVPPILMGYLFGTLGLAHGAGWLKQRWPSLSHRAIVIGLVVAVLAVSLPKSLQPDRQDKVARRMAGEWIRSTGISNPTIVTDHPQVAFYANGKDVPVDTFLSNPAPGPDYLVTERRTATPPQRDVLDRMSSHGWQAEAMKEFGSKGSTVTVYALKHSSS